MGTRTRMIVMYQRRVTISSLTTTKSFEHSDNSKSASPLMSSAHRRSRKSCDVTTSKDDIGIMETHLLSHGSVMTSLGGAKPLLPFRDRKKSCVAIEQLHVKTSLLPQSKNPCNFLFWRHTCSACANLEKDVIAVIIFLCQLWISNFPTRKTLLLI